MQTQIKRYNILLRGKVQRIGIDFLDGIKTDTGDMKSSLNNINNTLGTFVIEQREHNQWMKEHLMKMDQHNQRLEKILEKLAER